MICDAEKGMCIAGVFGGLESGVTSNTKNIFLEAAWFNPVNIRKTFCATSCVPKLPRIFDKGVDISNTAKVLQRAAALIKEIAGGITGKIIDIYPEPQEKKQVVLKYHYLKKLSGKNYHPLAIKRILSSLDFDIIKESIDEITISIPFSKPDILLPADIVEEIVRIDGLDNILIPSSITISPANDALYLKEQLREKIAGFLTGLGFHEILTNSITNSKYFEDSTLANSVKMVNSLSAELNLLRPSMLHTGLETIAYNINHKMQNLQLFEFGKTYNTAAPNSYSEKEHCSLYISGKSVEESWNQKNTTHDFFMQKE